MSLVDNNINGDPSALSVDRAVFELRRGRAFGIIDGHSSVLVAAVETLEPKLLERLQLAGCQQLLILSGERTEAMGLTTDNTDSIALTLPRKFDVTMARQLAGIAPSHSQLNPDTFPVQNCNRASAAGLQLAKKARLAPALITVELPPKVLVDSVFTVHIMDLRHYRQQTGCILQRVSEARVPLAGYEDCRFIVFRDALVDEEHVAITIGNIESHRPVTVRLHSACLTGAIFGSLRCDCGEQLRGAVKRIAAAGGGVLLYLAQEGRGIGLVNKLRAYELQDAGLDTLEADRHLGFRTDERNYRAAATMLCDLGATRIQLLTNNPEKMQALTEEGIDVMNRLPLAPPSNPHNERYVRTKLERAGHLCNSE